MAMQIETRTVQGHKVILTDTAGVGGYIYGQVLVHDDRAEPRYDAQVWDMYGRHIGDRRGRALPINGFNLLNLYNKGE